MIIITVLIIIAGLAAIVWAANWPFGTPLAKGLSDKQRRIDAEHNRRHHRGVARILLPILAIGFGVTSIRIFVGPKSGQSAAVVMAVCSIVCVGVFVALIKGERRRRSSRRR